MSENPTVVIVGAGHSGLELAARLQQLQVPALLVEKNPRIGDNVRVSLAELNFRHSFVCSGEIVMSLSAHMTQYVSHSFMSHIMTLIVLLQGLASFPIFRTSYFICWRDQNNTRTRFPSTWPVYSPKDKVTTFT